MMPRKFPASFRRVDSAPIKVLHIINDLSIGGAEMTLYKLLGAMNRKRFAPVVVSLRNRGTLRERIESLDVPVHSVAMRLVVPTPSSLWRFVALVRRLKPQVIHGWLYHGNLAAQLASISLFGRPPVLWSIRQTIYSFEYEKATTAWVIKLSTYLSRMPANILYNSRTSAAQHAAIGYSNENALIIPNGFDTEFFAPSEDARWNVRVELGVAPDAILIGLTGRYHPVKDHANFLQAAALLNRKYPNVRFVFSGKGVDWSNGPLRELIQQLGLVERVHLLGERQDMQRLVSSLDVAVSSSCMEGFPNVIGEAMSCGVPCVVTDVSDLPWIVDRTGYIVPPRNSEALASALIEMIKLGPGGREALGQTARRRVMEHFRLSSVVASYEEVYDNLISSDSARLKSLAKYRTHDGINPVREKSGNKVGILR
jgi:glycosyltransferase involved in cell wall biosynthesis